MVEKKISYYEIIDNMRTEKKKGNLVFYILTICIPFIVYGTFNIDDFVIYTIIFGIIYLSCLGTYIYRNVTFGKKLTELEKYRNEIDKYCANIAKDIYITEDSLMSITGGFSKNFVIRLDDITSVNRSSSDTADGIQIKLKDNKHKDFNYDENMLNILQKRIQNKKTLDNKIVESSLVRDLHIYDDYATGLIDVPGISQECKISIHDVDKHKALEYAEKTAKKVKEYSSNDFKDAIICSIWSYFDYLKKCGYDEFLYKNKQIPINVTEKNILNYMTLTGAISSEGGIVLKFEVPWEPEHGFSWVFKYKELIYVGSGQDVYPNSESSFLESSGNYARKYHKEVVLLAEEKKKLEQSYNSIVEKVKEINSLKQYL